MAATSTTPDARAAISILGTRQAATVVQKAICPGHRYRRVCPWGAQAAPVRPAGTLAVLHGAGHLPGHVKRRNVGFLADRWPKLLDSPWCRSATTPTLRAIRCAIGHPRFSQIACPTRPTPFGRVRVVLPEIVMGQAHAAEQPA